jgi:hypothetical protein
LFCGGLLFLYIRFIFYLGGWVFPFSDYGKNYILSNFKDVSPSQLVSFVQLVYFCRALASPMLSALIQSEYEGHQNQIVIKNSTKPKSKSRFCCGLLASRYTFEDEGISNFFNRLHLFTLFRHKYHFLTSNENQLTLSFDWTLRLCNL